MIPGISIKQTRPDDFEKIYPLLLEFNSPFKRDDWCRIFGYQWDGALDHVGFHLEKNAEIVGFMGLIFSCRYKDDRRYQFCNITSLIVKPEYRAATLLLLRKLMDYSDTIFTCLGPINESYRLMIKMGFVPLENAYKIIPVVNGIFSSDKKFAIDESKNIANKLDSENKRILLDHANLKCQKILFEYNNKSCLLIYGVTTQKHFSIRAEKIHIYYSSDFKFFNENIRLILNAFKRKCGFFSAIYIDQRLIVNKSRLFAFNKQINPNKMRSNLFINEIDVDALYSEIVLL